MPFVRYMHLPVILILPHILALVKIFPPFSSLSSFRPTWDCVVITGPRQVGKSTMIQKVAEGYNYVTFDDLEVRALAQSDPKMFFQLYKAPLIIDEVQYVSLIFPYIKMIIDAEKTPGQFILTSSESYKMMDTLSESLAGRTALLSMQGFSQTEINKAENAPFLPNLTILLSKNASSTVQDVFAKIMKGSMPAVLSGEKHNVQDYYSAYISTYLQKDIKDFGSSINSLKFFAFVTSVAARVGQIVNYASIARDCDINERLAKDWLGILERMGLIFYLYPYSNNLLKRTLKKPKLYFYDSGLAVYLTKWNNLDSLIQGAYAGAIFENFAISEIAKSYMNEGIQGFMYYYRDIDAKEIDLLIEENGTIYPIEIKKNAQPSCKSIYKTKKSIGRDNKKMGLGAVVCIAEKLSAYNSDLLIVPIDCV